MLQPHLRVRPAFSAAVTPVSQVSGAAEGDLPSACRTQLSLTFSSGLNAAPQSLAVIRRRRQSVHWFPFHVGECLG